MRLSVHACAKVNLCLLVGPARPDRYHELFTVFSPLDLCDRLRFALSLGGPGQRPGELLLDCPALDGGGVAREGGRADPESNLAVRALRALEAAAGRALVGRVEIEKHIPVGAGMGGGSSDAAAALLAGARVLSEEGATTLEADVLHSLGAALGADVPFFLGRGAALGKGIGDRLEPISLPSVPAVVVLPREQLSTPAVYAAFDRLTTPEDAAGFASRAAESEAAWQRLARDWKDGRQGAVEVAEASEGIASLLQNDLEAASFALLPYLPEIKQALLDEGAKGALMSGSGPAFFGVCRSAEEAEGISRRLEARGFAARTVTVGIAL